MKRNVSMLSIFALAATVLVLAPFFGIRQYAPGEAFGDAATVFWEMRVPRVILAFVAGAALALGGMIFQALFRNDLATPFTLGVSSGAALGATLSMRLGLAFSIGWLDSISFFAFGGALSAVLLVFLLSRARPDATGGTMLLAGVAVNFTFSSMILFIHYTSDAGQTVQILRWLMGSLIDADKTQVFGLLPLFLAGGFLALMMHRELNLLAVGEEFAVTRGVAATRTRTLMFLATSLMVGGVVAICGPVGFVGMMAPHICRLLVGSDHRWLGPASLMFGGSFLALCDLVARVAIAPAELPVGVVTALLGGPFFLFLLMRRRSGGAQG